MYTKEKNGVKVSGFSSPPFISLLLVLLLPARNLLIQTPPLLDETCGMRRAMKTFRHDEPETSYMHLLSSVLSRRMSSITRKTIAQYKLVLFLLVVPTCQRPSSKQLRPYKSFPYTLISRVSHNDRPTVTEEEDGEGQDESKAGTRKGPRRRQVGRYGTEEAKQGCSYQVGVEPFFSSSCSLLPFSSSFSFASSRLFSDVRKVRNPITPAPPDTLCAIDEGKRKTRGEALSRPSSKNLFPCSLARLLLLVDPPVLPETTLLLLPFSGEGITTLRLLNLLRSEDRRRPRAAAMAVTC
eukprot:547316-Hanusia_phi.AAC.1